MRRVFPRLFLAVLVIGLLGSCARDLPWYTDQSTLTWLDWQGLDTSRIERVARSHGWRLRPLPTDPDGWAVARAGLAAEDFHLVSPALGTPGEGGLAFPPLADPRSTRFDPTVLVEGLLALVAEAEAGARIEVWHDDDPSWEPSARTLVEALSERGRQAVLVPAGRDLERGFDQVSGEAAPVRVLWGGLSSAVTLDRLAAAPEGTVVSWQSPLFRPGIAWGIDSLAWLSGALDWAKEGKKVDFPLPVLTLLYYDSR